MKKMYLLSLMLFFTNIFYSQTYIIPNDLVYYFVNNEQKNIKLNDALISSKIIENGVYEITLEYAEKQKVFKLKPLTLPYFQSKFKSAFIELLSEVEALDGQKLSIRTSIDIKGENEIALLFTKIVSYYNTDEEKPHVATIYLKDSIKTYFKVNDKDSLVGFLKNVNVEMSFYGGFIEKIQVNGKVKGKEVSFNNKYSIGISATKNIQKLNEQILYTNEQFRIEDFIKSNKIVNSKAKFQPLNLNVADVIRYIKKIDVNANDISPVPQTILLDEKQNSSKLYKEESSKLFEAQVFTDFLGIFDEENPNGIIQTEVNKRFNIETSRIETNNKLYGIFFPPIFISEGLGFLQFFDAKFQYSKIEKNNKFLIPENFIINDDFGNVLEVKKYYKPISLFQYRNYSIGGMLNIFTTENQNAKLNSYLNFGFMFGRSGYKKDSTDEIGIFVNNLEVPIEYYFHLLPEKRVSIQIGDRLSWFEVLNSDINLKSIENDILTNGNKWINSLNFDLNVDISSSGRLFLRYRLVHELDNINTNFSQLQFGYSFYLLKNNGFKAKE